MQRRDVELVYKGRHRFTIAVAAKVTVLLGDSAKGKSTIARLASDYALVTKDSDIDVFTYEPGATLESQLSAKSNATILVVDEDSITGMFVDGCLDEFIHKKYYILAIARVLGTLQYSYKDVYVLRTEGAVTTAVRRYADYETLPKAEVYTCEDAGSGNTYFSNFLNTSAPMGGNANWKEAIGDCLIMDGACVGQFMPDLIDAEMRLFLPESFEFLLLQYYLNYTHEDAVEELSSEITFEDLYDTIAFNKKRIGFAYSKSFDKGSFFLARLIPEVLGKPNKYLIKWFETDFGFIAGSKLNNKAALDRALSYLTLERYHTAVLTRLPDVLNPSVVKLQIVYVLHDLGVKEFK